MTPLTHRPPSPLLRNVVSLLVALAAVGLVLFGFDDPPADAGAENEQRLIARFSGAIAEATGERPQNGPGDPTDSPADRAAPTPDGLALEGREALTRNLEFLQQAFQKLSRVSDYTAMMFTQERVGGEMNPPHIMHVKLRHEPFSIYMKWLAGEDKGRELLYVAGQNDGHMLVKLGGLKGRLLPAVKVDPHGALALSKSRHAITEAGLLNLVRTLIEHRRKDLQGESVAACRMTDGHEFDGRPCYRFVLEFASPAVSETYRKSVQFFDRELLIPVCIRNYGWPKREGLAAERLDEATLLEHYAYSDIRLNQQLADRDFDRTNAKYAFR